MKILILGSAGYLGRMLTPYLQERGHTVVGWDNETKLRHAGQTRPLYNLPSTGQYRDVRDICAYDLDGYDAVVHFAELPSAPYSMASVAHGWGVIENNVKGTYKLAQALRETNIPLVKLGCYDSDTEILTRRGWVKFPDLLKDDEVATRTADDRTIVFKKPLKNHSFEYTGKMYKVVNNRLDMLLTPNHRIFTAKRSNRVYGPLRIETAEEIYGNRRAYDISAQWTGKDDGDIAIAGLNPVGPLTFARFLGWYLSEGSYTKRADRENITAISIPQKYGFNCDILREDLTLFCDEAGIHYREYDDNGIARFKINSAPLANYLVQFGRSSDKYIPRDIMEYSPSILSNLLDTLILGDGTDHGRGARYYSISKQLADDVQEIALKCGWAATITPKDNGYSVGISKSTYAHVNHDDNKNDSWEDYSGLVHCVEIGDGHGIVLVRRNGKPVWSGNTMGEYGTPNIDIEEGWIEIEHKGRKDRLLYPKTPGSLYHLSKVFDSDMLAFACRMWDLAVTDLNQGFVYGFDPRTWFWYDGIWGTALNRFVAQAVAGVPLTVYGEGGQTRGIIHIQDTLRCIELALTNPPKAGEFRVMNQFTQMISINRLATMVCEAAESSGIPCRINHISNPRKELESHYYNAANTNLIDLGLEPHRLTEDTIAHMIYDVHPYKDEIIIDQILPKIQWA